MAAKSYELIDMEKQEGKHLVSVLRIQFLFSLFITLPLRSTACRRNWQGSLGEIQVPCLFSVARMPEHQSAESLPTSVRAVEGLKEVAHTPERCPDLGPAKLHPTAGATIVSAAPRNLVAVNMILNTTDLKLQENC